MGSHDVHFGGEDNESIGLFCSKCHANARFRKDDPGVAAVDGGGYTVDQPLQDKWMGAECPVE